MLIHKRPPRMKEKRSQVFTWKHMWPYHSAQETGMGPVKPGLAGPLLCKMSQCPSGIPENAGRGCLRFLPADSPVSQCLGGPLPTGELWKVYLSVSHVAHMLPSGPSQRHPTGDYSGCQLCSLVACGLALPWPGKVLSLQVLSLAPQALKASCGVS